MNSFAHYILFYFYESQGIKHCYDFYTIIYSMTYILELFHDL